ncbi:MAG: tetratricopeptide repeat protein [Rikenellaceae bacterium]|nr:tetratricopeptide repeat protein [Rikenellaceae bacterium]
MANKVQNPENDLMVETKGKLETFFDNYGNKLLWGLVAVTVIAVAIYLVVSITKSSTEKRENTAQAALTVALTTEAGVEEYVAIVEEYNGTKAANTATYMAGAEYLKAGDLANAKSYLEKYADAEGAAGEVINGLVRTLRGDIAVEENDLQTAADLYNKAIEASDDIYTYENNARKLALVYVAMGDVAKAQQTYKAIVEKYPELKGKYAKYIAE